MRVLNRQGPAPVGEAQQAVGAFQQAFPGMGRSPIWGPALLAVLLSGELRLQLLCPCSLIHRATPYYTCNLVLLFVAVNPVSAMPAGWWQLCAAQAKEEWGLGVSREGVPLTNSYQSPLCSSQLCGLSRKQQVLHTSACPFHELQKPTLMARYMLITIDDKVRRNSTLR